MAKNKPVHEVRYGSVRATVWKQESDRGPWHNVSVSRSYKDGDDWKDSTSFGPEDLLPLATALTDAFRWIHAQRQEARAQARAGAAAGEPTDE